MIIFFTSFVLGKMQGTYRTYFLFVEVHLLEKFLIKHFIFFLGYLIVDFIKISGGTIPTLRHDFEVRFVRKGSHMEFPVMRIKKSARGKKIIRIRNKVFSIQ